MAAVYNVGMVGLGHVATHHVAALAHSKQFRLIAGCDTDEARLRLLEPNVQTFTELDAMLALAELDVVIVASPNRMHVEHGIEVMSAGKWLVMEKPLAETGQDFDRFCAARADLNGKCTMALHAAHGVEMEWFCSEHGKDAAGPDRLVSFDARFYDPYLQRTGLTSGARSLGGSWIDSGINALSVICRMVEPTALQVVDSRMTRVAGSDCREVQGTVEFRFAQHALGGSGSIDTNWAIGRDSKTTRVRFESGDSYLLDHSAQQVSRYVDESLETLFSGTNRLPRLTNHYIGVFECLAQQLQSGADNFEYGTQLHELLYRAENFDA